MATAQDIIRDLDLRPHPEGGWYRETWREPSESGARDLATGIHFLLAEGQRSHWHRVDAAEMWIFNAGDPLRLRGAMGRDGAEAVPDVTLGRDLGAGHVFQHRYCAGQWQEASPLGAWTLVTCVVSPGFDFAGFELAPPGWTPACLR